MLSDIDKTDISSTWPLQHKIAACTLLRVKENRPSMTQLYDAYLDVCRRANLKPESEPEFMGVVDMLVVRGVAGVQVSKKIPQRQKKVWLRVNRYQLEYKLQDKTLIDSILAS